MSTLSEWEESRMYAAEKEENFRWLSRLLGTASSVVLGPEERVDETLRTTLDAAAEFAEIAHGSIDPRWVLDEQNRRILASEGMPLQRYLTLAAEIDGKLEPIQFIEQFSGSRGDLQGYCSLRPEPRTSFSGVTNSGETFRPQVILAFSGTSNARLAMYDIMVAPASYQTSYSHPSKSTWRVHDGFQRVYQGIKLLALKALRLAISTLEKDYNHLIEQYGGWDLVITAHSLGAAISYLFLLDLLHADSSQNDPESLDRDSLILPKETNVCLAVFGCPRVANPFLVTHYRDQVKEWKTRRGNNASLIEWSIIGHLDGVPALPPAFFGYAHFCDTPMYLYGGCLYRIPPSESEHSKFTVEDENSPGIHSKGGHNYYSVRDMELLQRRLKGIFVDLLQTEKVQRKSSSQRSKRSSGSERILHNISRRSSKRSSSFSSSSKSPPSAGPRPQSAFESNTIGEEAERQPSNAILSKQLTSEPEEGDSIPAWVEKYLERERAELKAWELRVQSEERWKSLRSKVNLTGLFSRSRDQD